MHYGDKFIFERVRCYSTRPHNKPIIYIYLPLTRDVPKTLVTDPTKEISRHVRTIRPVAESRDLRTAYEEMLLSKQLCVPTKFGLMHAQSVSDLV
ncbi:hypothetical protein ACTXT7_013232 [Hymenolepis weldensis]